MRKITKPLVRWVFLLLPFFANPLFAQVISTPTQVTITTPVTLTYNVAGSLVQKASFDLSITSDYASISLYADDMLLVDNHDIPRSGSHELSALVRFAATGDVELRIEARGGDITINTLDIQGVNNLDIPLYEDISADAGLDRVETYKYGGPCVADINNDGYYDLIAINHNIEPNKLYWNNGDGTVAKSDENLSRWYMHDLHGATAGDYDNDGDLDIIQTKGGGNGNNPAPPEFYRNDNGKLVVATGDVKLTEGARGRGAKWVDFDLDGDLDFMLHNAVGILGEEKVHIFYRNKGDGTFEVVELPGIQDATGDRALVTDLNGDNIDDVVIFGWGNTVWQGNGDFTFTEITSQLPENASGASNVMAATDIDIDNDGDLDLYFARGYAFCVGATPSFDFDALNERMDFKARNGGTFQVDFTALGDLLFTHYDFIGRNGFVPKEDFPIYLGSAKTSHLLGAGDELTITQVNAEGWPSDISENGIYFGYTGSGNWKAAVVINGMIFWNVGFGVTGVSNVVPDFTPLNRNPADILLRNDGGSFTDVSEEWNITQSGSHPGVMVGDFNNDGFSDLFVHRWGFLASKPADYMLLNNGQGAFETIFIHGASDPVDAGHGDMGQAFDFDLDGDIDMFNGSDEHGMWYLYENTNPGSGNYALVKVGYAPHSNVDPYSAVVTVTTAKNVYKKRVGSSGAAYSQSLLNIVHFGLGDESDIESISIRWRDGETVVINDKTTNQLFDTDDVDPISITVSPAPEDVRDGTSIELEATILPINANKDITWSSSNEVILTVSQDGWVTAVGNVGESATITATSDRNGIIGASVVSIVDFYPIPVASVSLEPSSATIVEGEQITLTEEVLPKYADNKSVTWSSSDELIATVNQSGVVTTLAHGTVTISATSDENDQIVGECILTVRELIAPSISYDDEAKYTDETFFVDETLDVTTNYHAGTGETIVASDYGGIKYWLRHMRGWSQVVKDYTVVDLGPLGTESGTSTASIPLNGVTPTLDLIDGDFYFLFVTMASSNGVQYNKGLVPINIVVKQFVASIFVDPTNVTLKPDETVNLTATVSPDDAFDKTYSWASDDELVATVSDEGVVTAISEGTATITVTTTVGGHIATCAITVEQEEAITSIGCSCHPSGAGFYPNPAKNKIILTGVGHGEYAVNIYNMSGKRCLSIPKITSEVVPLEGLEAGSYILKLSGGKQTQTFKLYKSE